MATNFNFCISSQLATLASCVAAAGGPQTPQHVAGVGSPEGAVVGYWTGMDQYFDTEGNHLWVFNGDVGGDTGWVDINP